MGYRVQLAGGYEISGDPARIDVDAVHAYIAGESYWAPGRDRATVARCIANSVCLGLFAPDGAQVGFARMITDRATSAHLCDVYVLAVHRGGGRGKALVAAALAHPELATVSRWTLSTSDAHGLYAGFGFVAHPAPGTQMVMTVAARQ